MNLFETLYWHTYYLLCRSMIYDLWSMYIMIIWLIWIKNWQWCCVVVCVVEWGEPNPAMTSSILIVVSRKSRRWCWAVYVFLSSWTWWMGSHNQLADSARAAAHCFFRPLCWRSDRLVRRSRDRESLSTYDDTSEYIITLSSPTFGPSSDQRKDFKGTQHEEIHKRTYLW